MCVASSTVLLVTSLAAVAASTAVSAYSSYQQGKQQKAMYEYEAEMNQQNVEIAGMQASNAANRAEVEKAELRRKVTLMRGEGRSNYAGGNVVLAEGSALDWESDLAEQEHLDRKKIDYNARLEQWGYGVQGSTAQGKVGQSRAAGANAYRSGVTGVYGSLLSGASKATSRAYSFSTS